ncbi:MAG: hypothetical protein PVJ83_09550 [Gammaproteobacteria bacterium]|jgi:hypothetical protein
MNPRFTAVLAVIGLLGADLSSAVAANRGDSPVGHALSNNLDVPGNPVPEAVWSLGIAVIGVVVVLRRKAA